MADRESIDHAAFERALERVESSIGASEMHGLMCGVMCTPNPPADARWLRELLGDGEPGDLLFEECRATLFAACAQAGRELTASGFGFTLMLPDDDQPLTIRSEALASWCSGFLYGLGMGGDAVGRELGEEAREVLEDFAEFTRMEADADAGADEERAFMELVEYVRMGVLLLREELLARNVPPPSATRH